MISIIVPVYNIENYLIPCIKTILNSTYQDYELILVDDGSTDSSGDICDLFASQDKRIKVIHQQNAGVTVVRNTGLKVATGEYIMFVDGDDVIHPQMIETLKTAIDSGDYDFSMIHGVMLKPQQAASRLQEREVEIDSASWSVLDQTTCIKNVMGLGAAGYQFHVVWNKLYKREIVEGLFFKDTDGEDYEWSNRMYLRARQGIDTGAELYYYIQRDSSITHKKLVDSYIERIESYFECYKEMPVDNQAYRDLAIKTVYSFMFGVRRSADGSPFLEKAKARCAEVYHKTRADLWHSGLPFLRKLRYECFYHMPWSYRFVMWLKYDVLKHS